MKRKGLLWLFAVMACLLTFTACSNDDDDNDDDKDKTENTGTGGGNSNNGGGSSSKISLVGKTYLYEKTENNHGNDNWLWVVLTFTSSTSYSVTKFCYFYQWSSGAYRVQKYNQTASGTYTISGNHIRLNGMYPYDCNGSDSWVRSHYYWELDCISGANALCNEDDELFSIVKKENIKSLYENGYM